MKKVLIPLATLLCLGCAGGQSDSASDARSDALSLVSDSSMTADGYTAVEMFKTQTGHLTVTLYVNGRACVFLVDTGGGATLIDNSKRFHYGLKPSGSEEYAAGIGSHSSLVEAEATIRVDAHDVAPVDDARHLSTVYLTDISNINSEFRRSHSKQVDGVLGTDFLDKYGAVVDYAQRKLYLRVP